MTLIGTCRRPIFPRFRWSLNLNDIGLDGDTSVHDETYTISIEYTGTIDGEISIQIDVEDDWTSLSESHTITILNRLPQISALFSHPSM